MNTRVVTLIAISELKTLLRSNSFRLIVLFIISLVVFLHVVVYGNMKNTEWIMVALPSTIPFFNAWIVNLIQIIITIFWVGNFCRVNDDVVLFLGTRPYSNVEFFVGKVVGFLIIALGLDILLGIIAMAVHYFFSESPFVFYPYLFYFLTLTVPMLVFVMGITIWIKKVIRSKMLAVGLLLVFFYIVIGYSRKIGYGIGDLLVLGRSNVFSDFVGFSGLFDYLLQRLVFFILGCGLLVWGVVFTCRLPNDSKTSIRVAWIGGIFFCVGLLTSFIYIRKHQQEDLERACVKNVFVKYQDIPKVCVSDHEINFKQIGSMYKATSKLKLLNATKRGIDSVVLYLNHGLEVKKLVSDVGTIPYHRDMQALVLYISMQADETKEIIIDYEGKIFPAVCYPEIGNIDSLTMKTRHYGMYNMGRDYCYLDTDYTLLTPECLWYPVTKVVHVNSPVMTEVDFTRFKLHVEGESRRVPIAQGREEIKDGGVCFTNEQGIPGLTLCIGNYTRKRIEENGVLYELFLFNGHEDLFINSSMEAKDIIGCWNASYSYAFKKLAIIEVPVHFCTYGRDWKDNSEYVQAELLLRPEKEALLDFGFRIERTMLAEDFFYAYRNRLIDNSRKISTGNLLLGGLIPTHKFISTNNESNLFFLMQDFHYYVTSSDFVGINLFFHALQTALRNIDGYDGGSALLVEDYNIMDALTNGDVKVMGKVMKLNSYQLLARLLCKIDYEEFCRFNLNFLKKKSFQSFDYVEYCEQVKALFGVDVFAMTQKLYRERGLAAFHFRDEQLVRIQQSGENKGYMCRFKVWNKGSVDGVIGVGEVHQNGKNIAIRKGECKEVRVYFEWPYEQFKVKIHVNLAKNRPSFREVENSVSQQVDFELKEGVFDADTNFFKLPPGEYIVDNEDSGCCIVEDDRMLRRISYSHKSIYNYKGTLWDRMVYDGAYGEVTGSFFEKISKWGKSSVEWNVNLQESGDYELFVWNNLSFVKMRHGTQVGHEDLIPTYKYRFSCASGEQEIVVEPLNEDQGWVSLGVYRFDAGESKIILSGQGGYAEQYIQADAVRWLKIK